MLLSLLGVVLLASAPSVPPSSCLSAHGKTACGYLCRASATDVNCASTPYGTCGIFEGMVRCFDPPLVAIHHPPDEGLRPECKAVRGEVACGFNCLVAKGKVACAQTPYGVCREHYGELRCWDPPAAAIHEFGADVPRPACFTASTALACGYDCKVSRSEVQCAHSPRGRCVKEDLRIQCFDPPSLVQCVHSELPSPEEVRKPKSRRRKVEPPEAKHERE